MANLVANAGIDGVAEVTACSQISNLLIAIGLLRVPSAPAVIFDPKSPIRVASPPAQTATSVLLANYWQILGPWTTASASSAWLLIDDEGFITLAIDMFLGDTGAQECREPMRAIIPFGKKLRVH